MSLSFRSFFSSLSRLVRSEPHISRVGELEVAWLSGRFEELAQAQGRLAARIESLLVTQADVPARIDAVAMIAKQATDLLHHVIAQDDQLLMRTDQGLAALLVQSEKLSAAQAQLAEQIDTAHSQSEKLLVAQTQVSGQIDAIATLNKQAIHLLHHIVAQDDQLLTRADQGLAAMDATRADVQDGLAAHQAIDTASSAAWNRLSIVTDAILSRADQMTGQISNLTDQIGPSLDITRSLTPRIDAQDAILEVSRTQLAEVLKLSGLILGCIDRSIPPPAISMARARNDDATAV